MLIQRIWQDKGEILRLLQAKEKTALPIDIAKESNLEVNAWVNCSTFNMNNGDCLGRNQGNLYDNRPDVNQLYSVVIFKDGSYKYGLFQSWDYPQGDYPVTAGFSPQAVLISNGGRCSLLSKEIGITESRLTQVTGNILVGCTKDGRWGFFYAIASANDIANQLAQELPLRDLFLLDGGGSCEMRLFNKAIVATKRKMPNILAICPPDEISWEEKYKTLLATSEGYIRQMRSTLNEFEKAIK